MLTNLFGKAPPNLTCRLSLQNRLRRQRSREPFGSVCSTAGRLRATSNDLEFGGQREKPQASNRRVLGLQFLGNFPKPFLGVSHFSELSILFFEYQDTQRNAFWLVLCNKKPTKSIYPVFLTHSQMLRCFSWPQEPNYSLKIRFFCGFFGPLDFSTKTVGYLGMFFFFF